MNTAEYRVQVQDTIKVAFLARLERYLELVDTSQSPEDHRKAVELLAKLGDVMPDKEQAGSLPVVHINFGSGSIQVQSVKPIADVELADSDADQSRDPRQLAQEMEMNQPVLVFSDPAALTPSPIMKRALSVNLDVEPLLFEGV